MSDERRQRTESFIAALSAFVRKYRLELFMMVYLMIVAVMAWVGAHFVPESYEVKVASAVFIISAMLTLIQVAVEFRLWWVQTGQQHVTGVGLMLRLKFFALGWRNLDSLTLNIILGIALIFGVRLFNYQVRMQVYCLAVATILAVNMIGLRLVTALKKENDGQPDKAIYDERKENLDDRASGLDERGEQLDKRGWDMSRESLRIEGVSRDQSAQQRVMDRQQADQDDWVEAEHNTE